MALSTARIPRVRGRPPLLAAGITSLIHSHSSSVRSLGYIVSFISPCYTTREDFSDRLSELIDRYLITVMPKKTLETQQTHMAPLNYWRDRLGSKLLADITRADVIQCRDELE